MSYTLISHTNAHVQHFRNGLVTSNLSKAQTSSHEIANTNEPCITTHYKNNNKTTDLTTNFDAEMNQSDAEKTIKSFDKQNIEGEAKDKQMIILNKDSERSNLNTIGKYLDLHLILPLSILSLLFFLFRLLFAKNNELLPM